MSGGDEGWLLELALGVGYRHGDDAYLQRLEEFGFHSGDSANDSGASLRYQISLGRRVHRNVALGISFFDLDGDEYTRTVELSQTFHFAARVLGAFVQGDIGYGPQRMLNLFARLGGGVSFGSTTFEAIVPDSPLADHDPAFQETTARTEGARTASRSTRTSMRVRRAVRAGRLIAADSARTVSPLPAKVRKLPKRWAGFGALAAAAAAIALAIRLQGPHPEPPIARRTIKGGELALELVRAARDGRLLEADGYTPDDRFRAQLSCPPGVATHADLVVYQDGRAFFPLDPIALACGNHRDVPGAFRIDGASPALVCVALAEHPIDRERIAEGFSALPELSACVRLMRR